MADYSATYYLATAKAVNMNNVGDTGVFIPFAKFMVVSVKNTNASVDFTGSSATMGLYTAPAAGGTALVTPATGTLTPLSAPAKVFSCTLASTDTTSGTATNYGGGQLYIRNGVAHGSAATVDVLIEVVRVP